RLLSEAGRLEAGAGGLGVCVRVERQHHLADEVLDEGESSAGGCVVGVGDPAGTVGSEDRLVLPDHRRTDPLDEIHEVGGLDVTPGPGRALLRKNLGNANVDVTFVFPVRGEKSTWLSSSH